MSTWPQNSNWTGVKIACPRFRYKVPKAQMDHREIMYFKYISQTLVWSSAVTPCQFGHSLRCHIVLGDALTLLLSSLFSNLTAFNGISVLKKCKHLKGSHTSYSIRNFSLSSRKRRRPCSTSCKFGKLFSWVTKLPRYPKQEGLKMFLWDVLHLEGIPCYIFCINCILQSQNIIGTKCLVFCTGYKGTHTIHDGIV